VAIAVHAHTLYMYRYGHTGGKSPRIRYTPDRTGLVVTASTCSVNEHLDLRLQFVREEMNSNVQDIFTQRNSSSSKRINKHTSKRHTAANHCPVSVEDVKLERANAVLMQRLAASRLALDEHTVAAAAAAKAPESRSVRMTLHKPTRAVQ
jgi:hypothetical protein